MADFQKKKRTRAAHKGATTRLIARINDLLAAEESPDASRLAQLRLSLEEKFTMIKRLDDEILDLTEEDGLAAEIEQADTYKEDIYGVLVKIEKHMKNLSVADVPATTEPPAHHEPAAPVLVRSQPVKLPKLQIKPFYGDIVHWTSFWDSYESAIHNCPALSDVDKFNYLKSLLHRSAADAISGLSLTAANYSEAIEVLKRRFGNKQQIIARHMDILLNVEVVTSPHHTRSLRRLYDIVESNLRSLKSLGVPSASYGSLLTSVLMNKLPQELRLIISRNAPSDDDWKLDKLIKELSQEVEARERAASSTSNPSKRQPKDTAPTATSLATFTHACCYCQQDHSPEHCVSVTHPDARKQVLRKVGRCFVCLRKGHISKSCRSALGAPENTIALSARVLHRLQVPSSR